MSNVHAFESDQVRTGPTQQIDVDKLAKQAIGKLNSIEKELQNILLERQHVIKDAILALAIGEHLLLLGVPGTGKSFLARCIVSHIDKGKLFEWLLNRSTDPSSILGPYMIKEMEKGRFTRNWTGMLPDAHVAFLDEIFKCNEPTLNIMLPILNERIFHDDGQRIPIKLRTLIAASNEGPDDDSLMPLYDRLLFRHTVQPVREPSNKVKMMKDYVNRGRTGGKYIPKVMISIPELEALEQYARSIDIPETVYVVLNKLDLAMEKEGITISDSRRNARLKVLQGSAALNGRTKVSLTDIRALVHILHNKDEDTKTITNILDKMVDPFDAEYKSKMERVKQIYKDTMAIKSLGERATAAVEAKQHITKILDELGDLAKEAKNTGIDDTKITGGIKEIETIATKLMNACLGIKAKNDTEDLYDSPFEISDESEMPF